MSTTNFEAACAFGLPRVYILGYSIYFFLFELTFVKLVSSITLVESN